MHLAVVPVVLVLVVVLVVLLVVVVVVPAVETDDVPPMQRQRRGPSPRGAKAPPRCWREWWGSSLVEVVVVRPSLSSLSVSP